MQKKEPLKVEKVKNRLFYNIGILIILTGFVYVFIRHGSEVELQEYLITFILTGTGFCAGARAYYFDRYMRIISKKPVIDLWTFLNDTKFEWLIIIYFFIRPVFGEKENHQLEKTRKRVNIYAFGSYILLIGLIIVLTIKI